MRSWLALSAGLATFLGLVANASDSRACGGCFHEPPKPNETGTVVTDHRMIFSVSPKSTTLYDQIRYQGDPAAFAWVLPIAGNVDVGLSADVLFAAVDTLTETEITAPAPPVCPGPPFCGYGGGRSSGGCSMGCSASASDNASFAEDGAAGGAFDDAAVKAPPPVEVTKQEVVGPYETVQLKATDPQALENWLQTNGFAIPDDVKPIIAAYQNEGFGFLALKLLPGQGIASMRPVRVTTPGAGLTMPLRMVAAGTGQNVGITLFVVSEGRYEPSNFGFFHIEDSDLVWDFSTKSSNYTKLRQDKGMGANWEVESSLVIQRAAIQSIVLSGGKLTGGGIVSADTDYLAVTDPMDPKKILMTADAVRQQDLDVLLSGMQTYQGRITRLRADLARASLAKDLTLIASNDQAMLSNQRGITVGVNAPKCPEYPPCPPDYSSERAGGGASCSAAANNASSVGLAIVTGVVALSIGRRRKKR